MTFGARRSFSGQLAFRRRAGAARADEFKLDSQPVGFWQNAKVKSEACSFAKPVRPDAAAPGAALHLSIAAESFDLR